MGHEYDAMRNMEARISAITKKQSDMADDVIQLKLAMNANTEALREYIEISKGFRIGLKFLGIVERTMIWLAKVAGGAGVIWAVWVYIIKETLKRLPVQ
jgi:hypothetical protein